MADGTTDSVERWAPPEDGGPPLIGELVERIEEALAIAKSSEAAVMTVGAAALDAAEQARRAAELAERASVAMNAAAAASAANGGSGAVPPRPRRGPGEDCLSDFSARADRISARLRSLGSAQSRPGAPVA